MGVSVNRVRLHNKCTRILVHIETCGGSGIDIRRVGITKRIDNGTVMFIFTTSDKNIWGAGIN